MLPTRATVPREHLVAKLDQVSAARLRLVVGPAGSGKTVLLRQLAAATAGRPDEVTVWCDADAASFVPDLARCLAPTLGVVAGELGVLLERLDRVDADVVVYLDDAHRLAGPSAATLGRLLAEAPPHVRFVVATRDDRVPGTAERGGATYRIGYQDLRFRTWDVERLFRDVYRSPLSPESAATLCAEVEGLPIALRLLHLDTALLSDHERAVAVRAPLAGSDRLRDFLTTEILGPLPQRVREFMVDASPLGVLDGTLCDTVLDRTGSGELLGRLAAAEALTFRTRPGGGTFRFHVLLQQLLEQRLAELRGPHLTRQTYHHAAGALMGAGHWAEAYRCFARADDWVATAGVLHHFSAHHGGLHASASVPDTLLDNDPWIALADARRLRGDGRLAAAYDRYLFAEDRLPDPRARWQCSLERSGIARWITRDDLGRDGDPLVDDVSGHLVEAVRRYPAKLLTRSAPATSPTWALGRVIAAMLDGRPDLAVELAEPLACNQNVFVALASRIVAAVLDATAHSRGTTAGFAALAAECEAAGWLWLARIARAATALLDPDGCADAQAVLHECRDIGDDWGALLAGYLLAVGRLRAGRDALTVLHEAIEQAKLLGAKVSETWLRLMLVDELQRRTDPLADGERGELDRLLGETMLDRASSHADDLMASLRTPAVGSVGRVDSVASGGAVERGVRGGGPRLVLAERLVEPEPPVAIRCFGRYALLAAGEEVDLGPLRAQARRVLRVLSMYHGQPLHEERLVAALWPDAPLKQAKHRLQVAISSLRALLRPYLPDAGHGIVRHGNAYLLRLPPGSTVDVVEFADALRSWRHSRSRGDSTRTTALGHRVLDLYRGELLSEEGPVEWVLARREAMRGEAAGVAAALARVELDRDDPAAAIEVCERALTIDELDNQLWALLAEARRRSGNAAAARRTQQAYRTLLAEC